MVGFLSNTSQVVQKFLTVDVDVARVWYTWKPLPKRSQWVPWRYLNRETLWQWIFETFALMSWGQNSEIVKVNNGFIKMNRVFTHCYKVLATPKTYCKMIFWLPFHSTMKIDEAPPTFGVMIVVGLLPKRGAQRHDNWYASFQKIPCQCLSWVIHFILALDFDNHEGSPSSLFPHVFLSAKTRTFFKLATPTPNHARHWSKIFQLPSLSKRQSLQKKSSSFWGHCVEKRGLERFVQSPQQKARCFS